MGSDLRSSDHGRRRREFAEPAPGVVRVRLAGDTVGADVIARILSDHPAVEVLTGPDRYDGGRQYITVRVRMDGGLSRDRSAPGITLVDCARCGRPAEGHGAHPDCTGWRSATGWAMDAPAPSDDGDDGDGSGL